MPRFGGALTARLMQRRAPGVTAILLLDDVDLLEAGRSVPLYDGVGTLAKGPSPVEGGSLLAALRRRETRHLSFSSSVGRRRRVRSRKRVTGC